MQSIFLYFHLQKIDCCEIICYNLLFWGYMKLVPLDIRQKDFTTKFKGFSKEEVLSFLQEVSDNFEELMQENNKYKDEINGLKEQLRTYQDIENIMKKTMITAQQIKDEMQLSSKKEYDLVIAEAKIEASKILAESKEKVNEYKKEITELERQKTVFKSQLESLINSHLKMLQFYE